MRVFIQDWTCLPHRDRKWTWYCPPHTHYMKNHIWAWWSGVHIILVMFNQKQKWYCTMKQGSARVVCSVLPRWCRMGCCPRTACEPGGSSDCLRRAQEWAWRPVRLESWWAAGLWRESDQQLKRVHTDGDPWSSDIRYQRQNNMELYFEPCSNVQTPTWDEERLKTLKLFKKAT